MSPRGADSADGQDFFEAAPCGYVVLDRVSRIVRANGEFLRLIDARAQQVHSEAFDTLLAPGGRLLWETHLWPMLERTGEVREIALELVRADGARVPVLLNARVEDSPEQNVHVIVLETRDRRRFEDDLLAAKRAAELASRQASSLAAGLQQTLIPPHPPAIPFLDLHAVYRPAGAGSQVGGDFYDIFQVDGDSWFVVLGDVSGKGVSAAIVTSFVRYHVRSLAMIHRDPADLLRALDAAVHAHGTDHYCTVAAVRMQRTAQQWDVALALAGHPPALARRPDGTTVEVGALGTPVGLVADPEFRTVRLPLADLAITLYTDGVTEARSPEGLFGDDRLAALMATLPHQPTAISEGIVDAALAWQDNDPSDDIAVVTFAAMR